jgi:hypothetical protein
MGLRLMALARAHRDREREKLSAHRPFVSRLIASPYTTSFILGLLLLKLILKGLQNIFTPALTSEFVPLILLPTCETPYSQIPGEKP